MVKLSEILPEKVISINGDTNIDITGVTYNSKNVKTGFLFVALSGSHVKGSSFIYDAMERGAVAVVTEDKRTNIDIPFIKVSNARAALSEISCKFYGDPSSKIKLIGVTGTKGKTTVTYLVQSILKEAYSKAFRMGTIEHDLVVERIQAFNTTPESQLLSEMFSKMVKEDINYGVIEVSSHALKGWRVEDLTFAASGFTNLSLEHTEFHPDMEDYFNTKKRFFTEIKSLSKPAVIMIDDEYGQRMASECKAVGCNVVTISIANSDADIFVQNIHLNGLNSQFEINENGDIYKCYIELAGSFNIANALMAAALCRSVGVEWADIVKGLKSMKQVPGRFETIANSRGVNVIVDYAHSPAALENVLKAVQTISKQKIITVFGCGGNRSMEKRPIMGKISTEYSDIVIVTSDNPRKEDPEEIINQIMVGISADSGKEIYRESNRQTAIHMSLNLAEPGDTILIAGKGHETGQKLADKIIPFDDRDVVRNFFLGACDDA